VLSVSERGIFEEQGRKQVKQEILTKIEELKGMGSMSYLTGIIALQLVEVFIKFMDEE
jgi:hypothetical protein